MPQNSCFVMELHKYGVYLSDKLKCTTTDQMERPLFNFDLPQHDITRQCGIIGQYDQTFDLKVNVSHCDLCFMIQWFCLISWRLFDACTSYLGIMNQYDLLFDLKVNVGHCDLYFMVQWFCLVSWRLFDVWTSLFGIMNQYDPTFDLKTNVGHYDLYFMVKWFALYLEDYLMYEHHYLGLWVSMTRSLTSKYI